MSSPTTAGALGTHLVGGLAEGERRSLGQVVGQEQLMDVHSPVLGGVRRVGHGDEVRGDELGALVDELVEGVLAVGARLTPKDLASLGGHGAAVPAHGLAVGLHGELLEVGGETVQVLRIREDCVGISTQEVRVPDVEQAHDQREIFLRRCRGEVLIDCAHSAEEFFEMLGTDGDCKRGADCRIYRVASADPAPESESIRRVDTKFRNLVQRR